MFIRSKVENLVLAAVVLFNCEIEDAAQRHRTSALDSMEIMGYDPDRATVNIDLQELLQIRRRLLTYLKAHHETQMPAAAEHG